MYRSHEGFSLVVGSFHESDQDSSCEGGMKWDSWPAKYVVVPTPFRIPVLMAALGELTKTNAIGQPETVRKKILEALDTFSRPQS